MDTTAVSVNRRYPPCGAGPDGGIRMVAARCFRCRADVEDTGGAHYLEDTKEILCGACCPYCAWRQVVDRAHESEEAHG